VRLLRIRNVIERYGKSRSPLYADMLAGVFVRPVKLGERAAGWPEHEVEQIIAARIRGDGDDAIRKLVNRLHEARRTAQAAA
jgi:prophage regulatory protein